MLVAVLVLAESAIASVAAMGPAVTSHASASLAPEADHRSLVAQSATEKLEADLESATCKTKQQVDCLAAITVNACASGCPRRGYAWRVDPSGEIDLHFTHGYLKLLRNAAFERPTYRSAATFGLPLSDLLYQQVQMLLRLPAARYQDASLALLPASAVASGSHTIDPARFHIVTWRRNGTAHAMGQADLGAWLISVARGYAQLDDRRNASYYLSLSERVFRSFAVRQAQGGVRNNLTGHRCYDGQFCYWFHSCPACANASETTVLNQHLHAVRDALESYDVLDAWRDGELRLLRDRNVPAPLPPVLSPRFIDELRDMGRGGLLQLAFASGNATNVSAPPNLKELLTPAELVGGTQRYHAAYRYYLGKGLGNIKAGNTCHYHFHSMDLLTSVLNMIHTNDRFSDDPYFIEIYYRLLYGRDRGDTLSCNNQANTPASRRRMNGVPLAELYQGSILPLGFHKHCDAPPDEYKDAATWENGAAGGAAPHEPRVLLDAAYANCIF
jgi:hypothetical protein